MAAPSRRPLAPKCRPWLSRSPTVAGQPLLRSKPRPRWAHQTVSPSAKLALATALQATARRMTARHLAPPLGAEARLRTAASTAAAPPATARAPHARSPESSSAPVAPMMCRAPHACSPESGSAPVAPRMRRAPHVYATGSGTSSGPCLSGLGPREARAYTRDQLEGGGLLANLWEVTPRTWKGSTSSAAERARGAARKVSQVTDLE